MSSCPLGNSVFSANYYTHGIRGSQKKEIERFAELMSDSLLRRRLPPTSKLGSLVNGAMQWLKDKLIKLGAISGLEPDVRNVSTRSWTNSADSIAILILEQLTRR